MTPLQYAETLLDTLEKGPQEISRPDLESNSRILCRLLIHLIKSTEQWPVLSGYPPVGEKK